MVFIPDIISLVNGHHVELKSRKYNKSTHSTLKAPFNILQNISTTKVVILTQLSSVRSPSRVTEPLHQSCVFVQVGLHLGSHVKYWAITAAT